MTDEANNAPNANQQENQEPQYNQAEASSKRGKAFRILGLVIVLAAIGFGAYYFLVISKHVTTDDAYVGAEIAQVTPSTSGTIQEIRVKDTDMVKAGDVLVVIDDTDAKLALLRAEADLVKAQVDVNRTKLDFNRRQALSKSGSVSAEEVSNSSDTFRAMQAQLDSARAVADQAKVDFDRTTIVSPVDGVVAKRQVQLGQRVQVGTPMMSVVPTADMHVDANFKEGQLRKVKLGQTAELTADIYGSSVKFHGTVVGFSGGTGAAFSLIPAQNATGNWIKVVQRLPVRIALNPDELGKHPLQVGLSMNVDIDIASAPKNTDTPPVQTKNADADTQPQTQPQPQTTDTLEPTK